jgi:hypothetical protein
MDNVVAILNRERATAMERLDALTVEGRDLRQRVREIDNAVTLLNGHTPVVKPSRASAGGLQVLVLDCVKTYGADGVTAKDVAASLTVGGRETSEASVSSTLSRMKQDGGVENRNGKWFAKSQPPTRFDDRIGGSETTTGDTAESDNPPPRQVESRTARPMPSAFDSDLDDDVPS